MKTNVLIWFKGAVRIQIEGKHDVLIGLMNEALQKGIFLYDLVLVQDGVVQATVYLKDIRKLLLIRKKIKIKIRFKQRMGIPFLLQKITARLGLIIGFLCFILSVYFYSNMIWDVKIIGASSPLEYEMEQKLKEMNITKGRLFKEKTNPSRLQQTLMEEMDHLIWVGVKRKGTIIYIHPVEKKASTKSEKTGPKHIVANKKAIITDIFAEKGQPVVSVHDFVVPEQILISGKIGKEGNETYVAAEGVVYGEIGYKTEVEVPLKSSFLVLREERVVRHEMKWGKDNSIPIWGFWYDINKNAQVYEQIKTWQWMNVTLPISLYTKEIYETEKVIQTYTKKEAREVGLLIAKEQLQKQLPKNSQIKTEKVLHEDYANGKVKLIIHFLVIEPISKEQIITEEIE
ncbi:MAG TPA: sporulation protein YqfD [Massilibacterium sp.]|nr:sporulation protein YqfD [Massilibacterium sp.]